MNCCSVTQSFLTLCNPMECSMLHFSVFHYFPEFAQTHVHWVDDAIQPSHPLLSPSPRALSLYQHQDLFQWVSSSQLEKEMATHSSVLAWRIPGMGEPGGLPFMGLHRVGHDWSDLAAAAAALHKWPKYWSFNFSISPSNEYSGLISCRTDWFGLLTV